MLNVLKVFARQKRSAGIPWLKSVLYTMISNPLEQV